MSSFIQRFILILISEIMNYKNESHLIRPVTIITYKVYYILFR